MPRVGPIFIDDCMLEAIRDDRLVVFAGAGISMGSPANLPDFVKLADKVAAGSGLARGDKEPIDRFLGRLAHKGVPVHTRAATLLADPTSMPTALHLDLMRLFRSPDRVRIVTTNFDLHFESAAQTVFERCPNVFSAPALPLGRDFRGVVHIHGSLAQPAETVLTDADFGRGYLTEGWARRFLVEVFRTYTVLFVGYSHDDVVMNYLARALPVDGVAGRYALTDDKAAWELLGIQPILFCKGAGASGYQELNEGIRCLSARSSRGVLDWQSMLAEIGSRVPPVDEETVGEIEQALREVHTTRFLLKEARLPDWPKWLNARNLLAALFGNAPLSECDKLLAYWLAEHYAIEHVDEVMGLVAAHNMRLHPDLWWAIGREIGVDDKEVADDRTLYRWVTILLASAPVNADHHVLSWLAERCATRGNVQLALEVFLFMASHRLTIKPGFSWSDDGAELKTSTLDIQTPLSAGHYGLDSVWTTHLKPALAVIALPLMSGVTRRLEEMHISLAVWGRAGRDNDWFSMRRSAIERHSQDEYPEPVDVLIDALRDALEFLAASQPVLLDSWIERLVVADPPLLRRLAIHALTLQQNKSADERLQWLLAHIDLHAPAEHHEVYRAVAQAYPAASNAARQSVMDAVLCHQRPEFEDWSASKETALAHFNWLSWLQQAAPECLLVSVALAPIKVAYPEWTQREHASSGWVGPRSPWTVEQLLAKPPGSQLDELLNFEGNWHQGPDRDGLHSAIQEACKEQPAWAFLLDEALTARALWGSDLWPCVLRGLLDAELGLDDWRRVLSGIARSELHVTHPQRVAELLYGIVRDGGKPFALELLEQANSIAFVFWQSLARDEETVTVDNWLSIAINRPAGVVVEFWISGLSLSLHGIPRDERSLPSNYRQWFTAIVQDESVVGGLGRCLLASQVTFLLSLDEPWTCEHIIPLFSSPDEKQFAQAWNGFLVWGRLDTTLAILLQPAFVAGLSRLDTCLASQRQRFIEFFSALAVFHSSDPTTELLPALFQSASLDDRIIFAAQLGLLLRRMAQSTLQDIWAHWLMRYWQNRLQSVPQTLDGREQNKMLEWLLALGELFPLGVDLAVSAPPIRIENTQLLYQMKKDDLVTQFPNATAELLIYLCRCELSYHAPDIRTVAQRLTSLEPELQRRLDEAMATAGA